MFAPGYAKLMKGGMKKRRGQKSMIQSHAMRGHGKMPSSPGGQPLARRTGYKGVGGDYAAAGPQQGFTTGGQGSTMGSDMDENEGY